MKSFLFLLPVIFVLSAQGQTTKSIPFDVSKVIGKNFPQFTLEKNGHTLRNDDLKGKIIFINFWFEGCPPCRAEMSGLNEMYDKLKSKNNFVFISISFDSDSAINVFAKENNIKYDIFHLDRKECYRLNFNKGFPTSFILDKTGVVTYCKLGGQIDPKKASKDVMEIFYPEIIKSL